MKVVVMRQFLAPCLHTSRGGKQIHTSLLQNSVIQFLIRFLVGLQTRRFQIGTIVDPDLDPFLNNGSGSRFDFESEHVWLVLDPVWIRESGSGSGTGST